LRGVIELSKALMLFRHERDIIWLWDDFEVYVWGIKLRFCLAICAHLRETRRTERRTDIGILAVDQGAVEGRC